MPQLLDFGWLGRLEFGLEYILEIYKKSAFVPRGAGRVGWVVGIWVGFGVGQAGFLAFEIS